MSHSASFSIGTEGARIPAMGFGTFQPDDNRKEGVTEAVLRALEAGYRHIDTAWNYGNGEAERGVGEALRKWNGKREEVFIVTKLANPHHKPTDVEAALELSLENLGLDYAPVAYERIGKGKSEWLTARHPDGKVCRSNAYDDQKLTLEGVSNFNIRKVQKILDTCTIKPAANQVEIHPYLLESDLIKFCNENGIHVTAFSPLGGMPVAAVAANADTPGPLHNEVIISIAEKHDLSPAQVLLKWGLQRGTSVIPKAFTPSHITDNFAVLTLEDLPDEDMTAINEVRKDEGEVRFINYLSHWGFDIFRPGPEDPTEER
ncbi:hypothetical protein MY4038_004902 [Beauveria bassiana]